MAITFPRALHECRFQSVTMDLVRYMARNDLYGGQSQAREMAAARWAVDLTTAPLSHLEARQWRAWWDSLRGGLRDILVYDPYAPRPAAHRSFAGLTVAGGSDPFTGDAAVDALTANAISVTGLPAGFVLTPGDCVGLSEDGARGLHRVIEAAVADGDGEVTLTVEPQVLLSVFSTAATAHFERPTCIMRVLPDSWSAPRSAVPSPVSFRALQVLR